MLLPLKVLAPVNAIEHMADWQMVAVSLGLSQDGTDYALGVSILVNPKLAKALEERSVRDLEQVLRQVLFAAKVALTGFLGDGTVE